MGDTRKQHFETRAIHAGHHSDPITGAVAPSIHLSTTFERDADGELLSDFVYIRDHNPNRHALEVALADLEGGDGAQCATFASGVAALHAVFQTLTPGDHVITQRDLYHGTRNVLTDLMAPWGLEVEALHFDDLDTVRAAFRPRTRLVLVESPSNPSLNVADIRALAAMAHEHGALCAVDSTWMTPVFLRPLELGADFAIHSCTKYFGGHSDSMAGAVIGRAGTEAMDRVRWIQGHAGAVPAPFDCWLLRRGLTTLSVRLRAQAASAQRIAEWLHGHPGVEGVHFPGLPSDPGHAILAEQAHGFGAMLSFRVRGGAEEALAVAAGVQLFTRATSLGGVESLMEHRATVEGPWSETPANLLRLSIGLEHVDDLIADLDRALG